MRATLVLLPVIVTVMVTVASPVTVAPSAGAVMHTFAV
jgi:hypothetical protein